MPGFVHREIAKAAREIAAEFYDIGASDNLLYKQVPDAKAFVEGYWSHFIQPATDALRRRLDDPSTPIAVKVQIADVLAKDATCPKGKMGAPINPVGFDERDWTV